MSSRCTMPARGSVAAAAWCASSPLSKRARPVAGRRMHDQAGGLVDHQQVRRPRAASASAIDCGRKARLSSVGTSSTAQPLAGAQPARRQAHRLSRRSARARRRSATAGGCARTQAPASPAPCRAAGHAARRRRRTSRHSPPIDRSARRTPASSAVDRLFIIGARPSSPVGTLAAPHSMTVRFVWRPSRCGPCCWPRRCWPLAAARRSPRCPAPARPWTNCMQKPRRS